MRIFPRVEHSTKNGKGIIAIWYVLYCAEQKENKVLEFCREHLSERALTEAFTLTYDRMRRYEGAWHVDSEPMFPGYVFLKSEDGAALEKEMEQYQGLVSALSRSVLLPVEEKEAEFLQRLCGDRHHMGMSRGYIRDGQTYVTDGPLRGYEQLIRRIDRHRRMARLELPGRSGGASTQETRETAGGLDDSRDGVRRGIRREMTAGLEIVSKN